MSESRELAAVQELPTQEMVPAPTTLGALDISSGATVIAGASEMATALATVIERQRLYSNIQGKKYVHVEGWTTLATMMGCLPFEVSNEPDPAEPGCYVAVYELRKISDGQVLARASAICGDPSDRPWCTRPAYARRAMAATRATSRVCRNAFSWVMTMAGYDPTPASDVPDGGFNDAPPPQQHAPARSGPSEKQINRLRAIAKKGGWTPSQLGALLKERYNIDSTSDLSREQYNALCGDADKGIRGILQDPPALEGEIQ